MHELNQGEQEEWTESDIGELTNGTETEANSVTDTEEEESNKELNIPEPRVEPEEEPVKPSVELEYTTPMPTFASTSRKLELSILMDMCKFMHNQQQTYWKYTKIFKNISNTFFLKFPDAIFETWMEDTDNASRDGVEKDKGNELEK